MNLQRLPAASMPALLLSSMLTAGCQSIPAPGTGARVASGTAAISLHDIHARGIEGRLGRPLGTVVEITGKVVPNDSRANADADEPFFLLIERVDGRALAAPVRYASVRYDSHLDLPLKIDRPFHLIAFETGAYEGAPDGLFKYVEPIATLPYGFVTHLVLVGAK